MSLIGGQIDTRLQLARSQPAMLLRATHIYQHTGRCPAAEGIGRGLTHRRQHSMGRDTHDEIVTKFGEI